MRHVALALLVLCAASLHAEDTTPAIASKAETAKTKEAAAQAEINQLVATAETQVNQLAALLTTGKHDESGNAYLAAARTFDQLNVLGVTGLTNLRVKKAFDRFTHLSTAVLNQMATKR
jgi:hypothetical protein